MKINDDNLGKLNSRVDEGIFLGYSTKIKGYKLYKKILRKVIECIDVTVNEELTNNNKRT